MCEKPIGKSVNDPDDPFVDIESSNPSNTASAPKSYMICASLVRIDPGTSEWRSMTSFSKSQKTASTAEMTRWMTSHEKVVNDEIVHRSMLHHHVDFEKNRIIGKFKKRNYKFSNRCNGHLSMS